MEKPQLLQDLEHASNLVFTETRDGVFACTKPQGLTGRFIHRAVTAGRLVANTKQAINTFSVEDKRTGDLLVVEFANKPRPQIIVSVDERGAPLNATARLLASRRVTASVPDGFTNLDKLPRAKVLKVFKDVGKKFGAHFGAEQESLSSVVFPIDPEDIWKGHIVVEVLSEARQRRSGDHVRGRLCVGYSSVTRAGTLPPLESIDDFKKKLPILEAKLGVEPGTIDHAHAVKTLTALVKALAALPAAKPLSASVSDVVDMLSNIQEGVTEEQLKAGIEVSSAQMNTLFQLVTSHGYKGSKKGGNTISTSPDGDVLVIDTKNMTVTLQ